jgi:hypothetical protein
MRTSPRFSAIVSQIAVLARWSASKRGLAHPGMIQRAALLLPTWTT